MKTAVSEPLKENIPDWTAIPLFPEKESLCSITDSGFKRRMLRARSMLRRIYTCISNPESSSLSLSSRAARRLNISYWLCTGLSCITFFTSHWSLFLASLIPALVLLRMRTARKTLAKYYDYTSGSSTNGT